MKKNKELNEPLDDLDKSALEQLKLKTEIIKIRLEVQEKKQPWILKNLGILIPLVLGIATLCTGYLSGFFNVQSIKLENQKHDLVAQVDSFTQKKDSLNRMNKALLKRQAELEKSNEKMEAETSQLSESLISLNNRNDSISRQNGKLRVQTTILFNERNGLKVNIDKLKSDIGHAAFNEYFSNICQKPDIGYEYDHLLAILNKNGESDSYYHETIKKTIDYTTNMLLKAVLLRLIYTNTNEEIWRQRLFAVGDQYCDSLLNEREAFDSVNRVNILNIFNTIFQNQDTLFKLKYIEKILIRLKDIKNNNFLDPDISNILAYATQIMSKAANPKFAPNQSLQLYKRYPKEFCFFMGYSIEMCLNKKQPVFSGMYSFVRHFAPICFSLSQYLSI